MSPKRRALTRAGAYGVAPPFIAVVGLQLGVASGWETPVVVGAALWFVLAIAFAAFAIARLEHRSRGAFTP